MKYKVDVIETRQYSMTYEIEADSPEEALERAQNGDYDDDTEGETIGISSIQVKEETLEECPEEDS